VSCGDSLFLGGQRLVVLAILAFVVAFIFPVVIHVTDATAW